MVDVRLASLTDACHVTLVPEVGADFTQPQLPPDWYVEPTVEGGQVVSDDTGVHLQGATAGTRTLYQAGRALEFEATFTGSPHQHAGLGIANFSEVPWIMFTTKFGKRLYARSSFQKPAETRLSNKWIGDPHRFRIEWNIIDVFFHIDDEQVAHQLIPVVGFLRPLVADARTGPNCLTLAWLRLSPYQPFRRYTSRVLDAGQPVHWSKLEWDAHLPAKTRVGLQVRAGDTARPTHRWSRWKTVVASGDPISVTGRYFQYRARLATSDVDVTPTLHSVAARYAG